MGLATGAVKAVALISGNSDVKGFIQFIQQQPVTTTEGGSGSGGTSSSNNNNTSTTNITTTHVKGRISGLNPGRLHAFHIHSLGDTTNGCISTGPHFNPFNKPHGSPFDLDRHSGDLGNILADSHGVAHISITDNQIPLTGPYSILGRAVVVHADPDDLGRGGHELSKTTGNAGARIGCGIIGLQSSV